MTGDPLAQRGEILASCTLRAAGSVPRSPERRSLSG
jgi:hypothetical protein